MKTEPDVAERIVKAIEDDICDRKGIGDEWEQIDNEIQAEIRDEWLAIVRIELKGMNGN
jgi:hypothetical protein